MSGLTAPPLVLLRSRSLGPRRINSRLSPDLNLSLDPAWLWQLAPTGTSSLLMPRRQAVLEGLVEPGLYSLLRTLDRQGVQYPSEKVTAHAHTPHPTPSATKPLHSVKVSPVPKKCVCVCARVRAQVLNIGTYKKKKVKVQMYS